MAAIPLSVPEAAASTDTIQFKLVVHSDVDGQEPTAVVFRSFQQISWLHEKLSLLPEVVVPPLPEPPLTSRMDDQDYVERKRLQIQRFFEKIMTRDLFVQHPDFVHFLSNDMAPTEVGRTHRGVLSFLRFNRVIRPNDHGFKSYKAPMSLEGNDQEMFHRHQVYIIRLESYFGAIAESLNHLIQNRDALSDVLTHMGDLVIETTQSKYRLGDGSAEELRQGQRALDHKMQLFGLLMDELGFISTRQGIEETMKFGDVMIEQKNSMDPLKTVFNARTQKLMEYVESVKFRNKKRDKADKLKMRMGMHAPEVQATAAEEQEAADALSASRDRFDSCQAQVKQEIDLFEASKQQQVKTAIQAYCQLNLKYERAKLDSLQKALDEMRQFQPKPVRMALLPDSSSSENEDPLSSSSKDSNGKPMKRRRRQKTAKPKAIQSSASLPTWKTDEPKPKRKGKQATLPSRSSVRVSPFAHQRHDEEDDEDDHRSRVHISASYDDRLDTDLSWRR